MNIKFEIDTETDVTLRQIWSLNLRRSTAFLFTSPSSGRRTFYGLVTLIYALVSHHMLFTAHIICRYTITLILYIAWPRSLINQIVE